jgi:hypothetical protein
VIINQIRNSFDIKILNKQRFTLFNKVQLFEIKLTKKPIVMKTILENLENKQALIKKLNVSINLNLLIMLLLFVNLYTVKIHLFVNEKSHLSEVICGFVLFAIILLNYLITLKWLKSIKLVRFSQNIRHLLNCLFMCWLLLAIFSEGRIALHEISIPLYLFFLIDLFFTLQQKNMLKKLK